MAKFNILYNGRTIHKNLSYEESTEILDEMAEKFYNKGEFSPELLELEVIENGN
jgi:hypothetical protein